LRAPAPSRALIPLRREVIVPERHVTRARIAAVVAALLVLAAGAVDALLCAAG